MTKSRLTGGEPLVRKYFPEILELLSSLNVELSLTSNAVSIDRHFEQLKKAGVKTVNISLDTLKASRFPAITFINYFDLVFQNVQKLIAEWFIVKINAVLMRGINEDEILDFVAFRMCKKPKGNNFPFIFCKASEKEGITTAKATNSSTSFTTNLMYSGFIKFRNFFFKNAF